MSWSFGAVILGYSGDPTFGEPLEAAMMEAQQQAGEWGPETRHQAQVALDAALEIAASGALGHRPLHVYCCGHAEPEHGAHTGSTNDSLQVTLRQVQPLAAD